MADESLSSLYSSVQRPSFDQLLGNVRRLSRDQVGCRLLQQALDEDGPEAASRILNEGISFWGETMVDPFGNYLFQKMLEKITAEERIVLVHVLHVRTCMCGSGIREDGVDAGGTRSLHFARYATPGIGGGWLASK